MASIDSCPEDITKASLLRLTAKKLGVTQKSIARLNKTSLCKTYETGKITEVPAVKVEKKVAPKKQAPTRKKSVGKAPAKKAPAKKAKKSATRPIDGSIWTLMLTGKEDNYPSVVHSVHLENEQADILEATEVMLETIKGELYDRGIYEEDAAVVEQLDAKQLLGYLNDKFNDRSSTYSIVRVYPPNSDNFQQGFHYKD